MQFSCESCKTLLQIADEKLRGKRLVVRCKRCGARITIADPALANRPPSLARRATPGEIDHRPRETDKESTRAMDSEVLEKALQASKRDEPLAVENGAPPAPAARESLWFAMLAGKQTGPLTRAQLEEKTGQGAVGPRTYLWKEGMPSWQRAKDVPEMAALFPELPPPAPVVNAHPALEASLKPAQPRAAPSAKPAPRDSKPVEAKPIDPFPLGERAHEKKVGGELSSGGSGADLARWASEELAKKKETKPAVPQNPALAQNPAGGELMFARTLEKRSGPPVALIVFALLAAAVLAVWFLSERLESPPPKPAADVPQKPAPEKPAAEIPPPEAKPVPPAEKEKPAEQTGLSADQVRMKLDENKPALQGCVDDALKRDRNLRVGRIHIATTIAPSGEVTSAKIDKRSVDDSPLGACLKRATMRIAFPPFSGAPSDVDIPIAVTAGE